MKIICLFLLLLLLSWNIYPQDLKGKWYGKLTQGAGGFRDTYDFELFFNKDSTISGISYAYVPNVLDARIGFNGFRDGDTIQIQERKNLIMEEKVPLDWVLCIKTLHLAFWKKDDKDFLRGRWFGVNKENGSPCVSGLIILARNRKDLKQFTKKGSWNRISPRTVVGPAVIPVISGSSPAFAEKFKESPVSRLKEIEVENSNLYIVLTDYDKIDNDSVSVYLNRQPLAEKVRLGEDAIIINFSIDDNAPLNELLLYAENEGKIPPNTAKMTLIDGHNSYKIYIDSEKHRSAAVYLKLKSLIAASEDLKKQKSP